MARDVRFDVGASSLDRHAGKYDEQHQEEALDTTAYVDELGRGEGYAAGECSGHDVADIEQTVLAKGRCNEWIECGVDGVLQESNELDEIDTWRLLAATRS